MAGLIQCIQDQLQLQELQDRLDIAHPTGCEIPKRVHLASMFKFFPTSIITTEGLVSILILLRVFHLI